MSAGDPSNDGFEAGLRRLSQQVDRSLERLSEMDIDEAARLLRLDPQRARTFLDEAGQWLTAQADGFVSDAAEWFERIGLGAAVQDAEPSGGPHPLDLPTPGQGLALSALDSGRWTIKPGSHVIVSEREGPAPSEAVDLVGQLRARDWIDLDGKVTLVGRSALKRWMDQSAP